MSSPRVALLLGIATCALAQYNSPVASALMASRLAGCYELRVPAWSANDARTNDLLPMRFELTMLRDPGPGGRAYVARNQDSKVRYWMVFPSWRANPDGTFQLNWSTGYVGYEIQFTKTTTGLRGQAHYWTDTDPYPPGGPTNRKSLEVVGQRVGCKESAK